VPTGSTTRDDRRRATGLRILKSARELFGERGYERTTIRAVAASASVDPALVMQHFGSKQGLFTAAVRAAPEPEITTGEGELVDFLVATLRLKLTESAREPMAMLRSMLTHPEATERAREVLVRQGDQIAAVIPECEDPALRGALVIAAMLGIRIGRELLELEPLASAEPERVAEIMRSSLEALLQSDGPKPSR